MPSRKYRFEIDGPERLEISWSQISTGVRNGCKYEIKVDEETVATIPTAKELETEHGFQLPDGSSLTVKMGVKSDGFHVTRDGVAISTLSEAVQVFEKCSRDHFLWGGLLIGTFAFVVGADPLDFIRGSGY